MAVWCEVSGLSFIVIKEKSLRNKTLHQASNVQWYNKIR